MGSALEEHLHAVLRAVFAAVDSYSVEASEPVRAFGRASRRPLNRPGPRFLTK